MPEVNLREEIKEMMVENLMLKVSKEEIANDLPLFGPGGLGLDSIDALELALAVSKKYGFQLRSDNPDNKRIFSSLRHLSEHIEQQRKH